MPHIIDQNKTPIALVTDDRTGIEPDTTTDNGKLLLTWLEEGVPALRGVQTGDIIQEVPITVANEAPEFMLALLDQFEQQGWDIID